MQIISLTMHDTKMNKAELDSMEKIWLRISHKIPDWLINQISRETSLPISDSIFWGGVSMSK